MDFKSLLTYVDKPLFQKLLAVYFREQREHLQYSIEDVCAAANITKRKYNMFETARSTPTCEELERLSDVLQLDDEHIHKLSRLAFISYIGQCFESFEAAENR